MVLTRLWGNVFLYFFHHLVPVPNKRETVLSFSHAKVTDDMNRELTAKFIDKDVKGDYMQMLPTKAPGLDGF